MNDNEVEETSCEILVLRPQKKKKDYLKLGLYS
jgi:hypothetical protein